jgi:hypothetical protein
LPPFCFFAGAGARLFAFGIALFWQQQC